MLFYRDFLFQRLVYKTFGVCSKNDDGEGRIFMFFFRLTLRARSYIFINKKIPWDMRAESIFR